MSGKRLDALQQRKKELLSLIREEEARDRKRGRAKDNRVRMRLGALAISLMAKDPALRQRLKTEAKRYFTHRSAREDLGLDAETTWFDQVVEPDAADGEAPEENSVRARALPPLGEAMRGARERKLESIDTADVGAGANA